jgi:hypothetical protein
MSKYLVRFISSSLLLVTPVVCSPPLPLRSKQTYNLALLFAVSKNVYMAMRRGKRHQFTIDGQTVWLDSLNEQMALTRFIEEYGFSNKWKRPTHGIKHAGKFYTPDFELAINDHGQTSRALVEVKEYQRNFTKDMATRMRAVASHYHTDYLLLYAVKTYKWYRVKSIICETTPPQPGILSLAQLFQPKGFITTNHYGRKYQRSWLDVFLALLRSSLAGTNQKYRVKRRH